MTSSIFSAGGVSQIVAGSGVSVSPGNGKGVVTISSSGAVSGVSSFNTRSGAVFLTSLDVIGAIGFTPASIVSPDFTGSPTAITPTFGTNNSQLATTAFVQNAVVASTSGVVSFNTRSGAVTLTSGDIVGALGYTPPNQNGATLTGVPTAPTATIGTNNTQLATTAFVQAAVTAGTAGVASFKSYGADTPRTGAVTLLNSDIGQALGAAASTGVYWNASYGHGSVDAGNSNSLYFQRKANYSGGTAGFVNAGIYLDHYTPLQNDTWEWGIVSNFRSYSENRAAWAGYASPQNVAIGGILTKYGTAPVWAGNFASYDRRCYPAGDVGALIGLEVNIGGLGNDPTTGDFSATIGIDNVPQVYEPEAWVASKVYGTKSSVVPTAAHSYAYSTVAGGTSGATQPTWPTTVGATVVDGTITWTCQYLGFQANIAYRASGEPTAPANNSSWKYGFYARSSSVASFYSKATAIYGFGVQLEGSYAIAIDTSTSTNSSGIALRMKSGDAIAFDQTSNYKMSLNAASGLLEFYNGSTRHGYINIGTGADVNFNAASGGGAVSSFNSRTGAVTLSSADVVSALGYTPANATGIVDISSAQTITGAKTLSGATVFNYTPLLNTGVTLGWNSGGGNVAFGSGKTNAFYIRIFVDGAPYYIQALNP